MKRFVLSLMSVSFLFVACSSEDMGAADGDSPGATPATTVSVKNNVFEPATVTVRVGDTVRWAWTEGVHDVKSGASCSPDGRFDSGPPVSGATFDKKFDAPGTYDYYCTPHCTMGMTGKVIVQ